MSGTGGGPSRYFSLTPLEEEVASLLSMNDTVNGTPGIQNFGSNNNINGSDVVAGFTEAINEEIQRNEHNENEVNSNVIYPPNQANLTAIPDGNNNLLKFQVQNQCAYHENSIKKLSEVCDNLKSISRYARKTFELKEEKLKLAKEKFEFKKKHAVEKNKLKKEKLEIKKKMLDLKIERLKQNP